MKRIIFFLLLSLLIYLSGCSNIPVVEETSPKPPQQLQIVKSGVMPADIIAALNAKELGEENSVYNKILGEVELPRSLGISIPNIDMTKVHNTYPLQQLQRERLMSKGFSNEEIATMDYEDYINIEKTWLLTPDKIKNIKNIYPELTYTDLSQWTNGDFLEYFLEADAKTYAPTLEQTAVIKARGITLDDARKLLKDFHSYDTILEQDDGTLKELLERYYQFTIDYINHLAIVSEQYTKNIQ